MKKGVVVWMGRWSMDGTKPDEDVKKQCQTSKRSDDSMKSAP